MKVFSSALLAVVVAGVAFSHSAVADDEVDLQPHQVREAVSLVLTREAAAKTPEEQAAAVRDLSTLYLALARDTEMAREPKLKLKAKMYSRLIATQQQLARELERRKKSGDYPLAVAVTGDAEQTEADARGGAAVRDYGEVLVELIQETISPAHWDVNGGPGSIVYWPNLQVLVVRASGDAHGHVGGLFDGLRAAK